ncbi:shikimate dehydrogenase [uncultured Jatrophihabitans sp.]|uniref:shikimate dehydrogenase n=1 Tax=uncultured Jatrophihabitans sp. TaxID=1610747 RepID=UPI0035CC4496
MAASTARRHAGVLGRPITHSLSPVLHRAAYSALGLDVDYTALDCGVAELPEVLAARADWLGFSATMPVKRALLDVADDVSALARTVGAANTLLPAAGGWLADNTDVAGITATLADLPASPRTATVLGAGGTAQAVLAALPHLGVTRCTVLVRDRARTAEVRATATRCDVDVTVALLDVDADALGADLVVSTLPAGAADPFAPRRWAPRQTLLDVIYAGWPTPLAGAAAAAGAQVRGGATMLLHQAAEQVRLMTGCPAPVDAMRAALLAAEPDCGA